MSNHTHTNSRWLFLSGLLAALLLSLLFTTPAHAQGIEDGLVGYWPFDEGSGSTSRDFSGNNNTATLHTPNSFTTNAAPTDFANPAAFASVNNANSYATAPGNNLDNLQHFTIAFWVRINAATPFPAMTLISLNNGKASFGYYDRGNLYFDIIVNGLPRRLFKLGSNIADGTYHHLAASYDGTNIRFYYDGALYSTLETTGGPVPSGQGVSFSTPTAPLNGALDDVRIYNRALTNIEVATLVYNCNRVQGIPASECRALVAFANSTHAEQWVSSTQWLANTTPCNWTGVLCNNGHVIVLNLPQNRLAGALPSALGNLSELLVLNLANNQLTGDIPFELGNLGKLQTLDLYGNQLSGQIPFTLGNLPQLQTLRLYNNRLRGTIPPQLTHLTNLLTLDLGYNTLSAVDAGLVNFLNSHQPTWAATQTVPPINLKATVQSSTSISLTWTPISYTTDGGYYEVLSTTQTSGIYKSAGKTANKSVSGLLVTGLASGQTYSFVVRTFTPKHGLQQNDLASDSTDPLAITLTVNKPPVAVNDNYATPQDTPLIIDVAHGLLANDSDPDGNALKIGSISSVNPGSKFTLNLDGSFTYTPALGFVGTETFTYQASDGQALSNQATVAFQVNAKPAAQLAKITIALDVQPDSKTNFNFTGSLGAFLLDDITPQDGDAYSNSKTFTVPAGTYTVTEQLVAGYLDANIFCSPPAGTIADLTKHQISINAVSGANVTCTFVVQRAGQIIAGKYNDHNHNHSRNSSDEWLNNWQMQMHSPFTSLVTTQVTTGEGRTVFNNLFAGNYTVCEVPQTGWFSITPNPIDAIYRQPCYMVTVTAGQAVWVRFGNSTTPLVSAADDTPITDIVVCDLPATDDDGNEVVAERDPWEEEEEGATSNTVFLPLIQR
ncbi:MAG: Ig-like domain-containing protein [Chloroflexi bacterium]|nr:Ig-like domain-containing protein [Chloroflexota bacterium]